MVYAAIGEAVFKICELTHLLRCFLYIQEEDLDPTKIRKVKLLYQSGNAMVVGSDWIAHALVLAGQALARGISK